MNFYTATYKRQYLDNETGLWEDTCYTSQRILIIANSIEEATAKISELIECVEDGVKYKAVQNGKVVECRGLDLVHGYDSFHVLPIE